VAEEQPPIVGPKVTHPIVPAAANDRRLLRVTVIFSVKAFLMVSLSDSPQPWSSV
jgi:hypothetical protein